MEVCLLGAVAARAGGQRLDLGPRKQRLAFAVLALNVNQLVTIERLVDLTWTDAPPPTAQHAIHVRVSALRATLATVRRDQHGPEIGTHGSAYVLRADPLCVDVHRFRALVAEARTDIHDVAKVALFRQALDLWNGPPLADVATPEVAGQLCRGLEEARLTAAEECLDAELRLGLHRRAIDELIDLTAHHPYRQRLVAQLMLALYRAGRAPDALNVYQDARLRLATELGLDPEQPLRNLQEAILRADPALDLPGSAILTQPLPPVTAAAPFAIEVRRLAKRFGDRAGLEEVSFTVRAGAVVGLLGPNGAGKSTLIRLLSGVLTPTSGDFAIAGVPSTRPAEIRARIGVLPENPGYPTHHTGRDYLREHAQLSGLTRRVARSAAERLLGEVGLADRAGSPIAGYSLGLRRRLGIARALLNDPEVLLLDEPTLGLDPAARRRLLAEVRELARRRGVTVLLSSPSPSDVDDVCTDVVTLDQGRIVAPEVPGCRGRVSVPAERLAAARRVLAGIPGLAVETDGDGFTIQLPATHNGSSINVALRALLDADVPMLSFHLE